MGGWPTAQAPGWARTPNQSAGGHPTAPHDGDQALAQRRRPGIALSGWGAKVGSTWSPHTGSTRAAPTAPRASASGALPQRAPARFLDVSLGRTPPRQVQAQWTPTAGVTVF